MVEALDPSTPAPKTKYKCHPRPIPECLDFLHRVTEAATDTKYNFSLVSYYATGADSISFHSERREVSGAGSSYCLILSWRAKRDFLMKHKPLLPVQYLGQLVPQDCATAASELTSGWPCTWPSQGHAVGFSRSIASTLSFMSSKAGSVLTEICDVPLVILSAGNPLKKNETLDRHNFGTLRRMGWRSCTDIVQLF
jgi:hypothetical protein